MCALCSPSVKPLGVQTIFASSSKSLRRQVKASFWTFVEDLGVCSFRTSGFSGFSFTAPESTWSGEESGRGTKRKSSFSLFTTTLEFFFFSEDGWRGEIKGKKVL